MNAAEGMLRAQGEEARVRTDPLGNLIVLVLTQSASCDAPQHYQCLHEHHSDYSAGQRMHCSSPVCCAILRTQREHSCNCCMPTIAGLKLMRWHAVLYDLHCQLDALHWHCVARCTASVSFFMGPSQ